MPPIDPMALDLRAVVETLRSGRATDAWMRTWLPAMHESPERAVEATYNLLGARRGAVLKSRPEQAHDLYHDLLGVHLGRRRTALIEREGDGWARVSYEALNARSNALAAAWLEQKAEPGQAVALVDLPGSDLAVALLTAFRLGMVASPLPPRGPAFVRLSLGRIKPDWVAAPARHRMLAAGFEAPTLPWSAGARSLGPGGSHGYAPGEAAARLLAPLGAAAPGAVEVEAARLLEAAARDALFVYGLDEAEVLAAPEFEPLQHGLSMLLASLAAGSTLALVADSDWAAEPALLTALRVTVLGVQRQVRDRLVSSRGSLPAGARWFRSLSELTEPHLWDQFFRAVPTPKQPGFSVISSSAAGACLFSPPTSATAPTLRLWPAPGLRWRLDEVAGSGVPALNATGAFAVLRGEDPDPGVPRSVLGPWNDGLAYAGSLDIGPDGAPYPDADVEQVTEQLRGVRHAVAFVTPGRWLNDARSVLLVFVEGGPGSPPPPPLHAIEEHLVEQLGGAVRPDRIEIMPLRPRMRDGMVDRSWCRSQYMLGVMSTKARSELFQRLGRLGYLMSPKTRP